MTVRESIRTIEQAVLPLYDATEATAIARLVVSRKCGYTFSQLVLHYDDECQIENFDNIVNQLAAARPVQ